jgi:hypothetical protein
MDRKLRAALVLAAIGISALAVPQEANAAQVSFELRQTVRLRITDLAKLGVMVGMPLSDRCWAGVGYEFFQDYDAVLWSSETSGHKPVVMSGIRAGSWYRGGAVQYGMTYSMGGILTVASPAYSPPRGPNGIDNDTWVVDFGADLTFGYVWSRVRLGVFATPAWSYGRIASPAAHKSERYSAFTYRVGLAFAVNFGH